MQLLGVALASRRQICFLPTQPTQLVADDALGFGQRHLQTHLSEMVLPHLAVEFFKLLLFEFLAA